MVSALKPGRGKKLEIADIATARQAVAAMAPLSIAASLWFWWFGVRKTKPPLRLVAVAILGFGLFVVPTLEVLVFRALADVQGRVDDVALLSIIITEASISLIAAIAFAYSQYGKL